jgi:CDP-diacylglycerol--glycerol-3-phosphate 3-phosphatidyltransferase
MVSSGNTFQPITFSDKARHYSARLLLPIGRYLVRLNIHPDVITLMGLVVVLIAAIFIVRDQFIVAGIILLLGMPLDALDGTVARLREDIGQRPFGGFLDSTLDRYADSFIFGAFVFYGQQKDSWLIILLALAALTGAYLVSYTRARAEAMGCACKIGLFTRLERVLAIFILVFTGWVVPLLWVLALGTHFTALQRIWHVRQESHRLSLPKP